MDLEKVHSISLALQTKDTANIYIYIYLFHKLVEKDAAPRGLICFTSSNQSRFKLNFLKAY
jgi:hypothetical protein